MTEIVCRARDLHCREWDGEYVVYNQQNDRTHLVTGFAAQAFSRLEREPCAKSAMIEALKSAGAAETDAESSLAFLKELELIEIR